MIKKENTLNQTNHSFITLARYLFLALIGSILLVISAKYKIPFWPIPLTLQTLFVLLIPLIYDFKKSMLTISLYLTYGLLGLPVFANGGGIVYFIGPSAGYLYGFFFATLFLGYFKDRGVLNNNLKILFALFIGDTIIFALGVSWLANILGWVTAINVGFTPFIIGEIIKIIIILIAYNLYNIKTKK